MSGFHDGKGTFSDGFGYFKDHVSGKTVADNHVRIAGDNVISFRISDEIDFSRIAEFF